MKKSELNHKNKQYMAIIIVLIGFIGVLCVIMYFLPGKQRNEMMLPVSEKKSADVTAAPKITPFPASQEKVVSSSIRISGLQEETLQLLQCTKRQLVSEIREFLNSNGFADVTEVVYGNEIVISHADNSVSVVFYLQGEGVPYEICCIYDRENDFRTMVVWES